jgi:hypothetical protein
MATATACRRSLQRMVERSRSAAGERERERDDLAASHGFVRWLFALSGLSLKLADRRPANALALRSTINNRLTSPCI